MRRLPSWPASGQDRTTRHKGAGRRRSTVPPAAHEPVQGMASPPRQSPRSCHACAQHTAPEARSAPRPVPPPGPRQNPLPLGPLLPSPLLRPLWSQAQLFTQHLALRSTWRLRTMSWQRLAAAALHPCTSLWQRRAAKHGRTGLAS
jgi:hypothetical protein